MYTLFDIIGGTPYWAWILLAYLLFVGIKALKSRTIPLNRLAFMPLIFTVWSLTGLYGKPLITLLFWSSALLLGIYVGWFLLFYRSLSFNKKIGLVHLPGSSMSLCLSLVFFCVRYAFKVASVISHDPFLLFMLTISSSSVSGFVAGIAWGRFFHVLSNYKKLL